MRKAAKPLETQNNHITSMSGTFNGKETIKLADKSQKCRVRHGIHCVRQTPGLNLKKRWETQLAVAEKQTGNNQDSI